MRIFFNISDQLNKDTDDDKKYIYSFPASTSRSFIAQAKINRNLPIERLFNRALQEVRENWMQMHDGQRAWTQALFVRQLSQQTTRYDLCSTGYGSKHSELRGKLQKDQKNPRRNQRHQQGTSGQKGEYLAYHGWLSGKNYSGFCRSRRIDDSLGEHGPKYPGNR